MEYFFGIGIPCYNCAGLFIDRLLDSIESQHNVTKIVYMCDDSDNDELEKYYNETIIGKYSFPIKYFRRTNEGYKYHCPGNTRREIINAMLNDKDDTFKYLTSADNDDMFEEDSFIIMKNFIEANYYPEMVHSVFREWQEDGSFRDITGTTWTHGNFYNWDWIKANNINYKPDVCSHEDLYWNSTCSAMLETIGKKYLTFDECYIYRWIYNPNSLSREPFQEQHFYIEKHLGEFLQASLDAWIDVDIRIGKKTRLAYENCMAALLYGYFYYQAALYRLGDKALPESIDYLRETEQRIRIFFDVTKADLVHYVYEEPLWYNKLKFNAFDGSNEFVELQSFKDFIYSL